MLHRERLHPPDYVYPLDEWRMIERQFYPRFLAQTETLFATANGYLGMRGTCEEGEPVVYPGTFINGFHETWPITYGEEAYGFATTGQTMINVTDGKTIRLYVDDEPFFLPRATLKDFERVLDMQAGSLDRSLIWETPAGKRVSIKSRRIVSLKHRHLAAIEYEVTLLNIAAPVVISSELVYDHRLQTERGDPRKGKGLQERPLRPEKHYANDLRLMLAHRTNHSDMGLACGAEHVVDTGCPFTYTTEVGPDEAKVVFKVDAKPEVPIRITKYLAYHTSGRWDADELCERAERTLDQAAPQGFSELATTQRAYLDGFWDKADIKLEADLFYQRCLRWNVFQLCQAAARTDGTGIAARGLTGQTYEGHYFWDTEIYVLPFLIYTSPRIARSLLKFRHGMLDKARQRAEEVGEKGALFPWRTINGEEASAYYAAGTAQYHINADVIYALRKYVSVTGDTEFLFREGAEMLVETARMWCDLGFFSKRAGGQFCIHAVTGPDEYATVVNNNAFTNLMARENLRYAAQTVEKLVEMDGPLLDELIDKTGLEMEEVANWKRAAEKMRIPFDESLGINPQDDSFLERERWDFENTPEDHYPLLLHYHPLVLYRHQVIKQADVALAMFLLSNEFTEEEKRRNFEYYDPITTGDSSLSVSVQSILAFELGKLEVGLEYARYAALMDLADVGGNVQDGAHIASIGGSWMAVVYGFAGMRDYDGELSFNPLKLDDARAIGFSLTVRGNIIDVELKGPKTTYRLREGTSFTLTHRGEKVELTEREPLAERD